MYLPTSFWTRLAARAIDEVGLFIFNLIILIIIASFSLTFTSEGLSASLEKVGQCIVESSESVDVCISQLSDNSRNVLFILAIIPALVSIAYYLIAPLMSAQTTLGKRLLKIKVVNHQGGRINIFQSLTREIFFILFKISGAFVYLNPDLFIIFNNVMLFVIIFDVLRILLTVSKSAFHDSLSYTYVVLRDPIGKKLD